MVLLILSSFFIHPSQLFSKEVQCSTGKIRYELMSGIVQKDSTYCINENEVISSNCKKNIELCIANIKNKKHASFAHTNSNQIGSPGFKNCKEYGGTPRFAEFKRQDKWQNIATCFFDKDETFIDNDLFYELTHK